MKGRNRRKGRKKERFRKEERILLVEGGKHGQKKGKDENKNATHKQ